MKLPQCAGLVTRHNQGRRGGQCMAAVTYRDPKTGKWWCRFHRPPDINDRPNFNVFAGYETAP